MKRQICIALFSAAAIAACKSPEPTPTPETKTSAAQPAPAVVPADSIPKTDPASVKTLGLDPAASKFDFDAAKITKTHHGSFKQFSGKATLLGDDLHSVAVEVETPSVEVDDPKLTGHLKTADFLDVEKFPKATFKSSSITPKASGSFTHEVTGELTLHGVTQSITFPATVTQTPTSVTGTAEVTIDRQKFGVKYPGMPDDLIKDAVVLKPTFVFSKN
jgi:polyisoprenoid-binding protein YceI